MIIVDSSVWIDALRGVENVHTIWLQRELGHSPVAITDLIFCEVLQGAKTGFAFEETRRKLAPICLFSSSGQSLATASAQNYRHLRARGNTVRKTIDCLIATLCIRDGHELLHRDRDFDPFEHHLGLRVLHPKLT